MRLFDEVNERRPPPPISLIQPRAAPGSKRMIGRSDSFLAPAASSTALSRRQALLASFKEKEQSLALASQFGLIVR